jgi:hypothetical protein
MSNYDIFTWIWINLQACNYREGLNISYSIVKSKLKSTFFRKRKNKHMTTNFREAFQFIKLSLTLLLFVKQ